MQKIIVVLSLLIAVFQPAYGQEETGSLKVKLTPPEAVAAGAMWRRVGTDQWHESGFIEDGVPKGAQTIEFIQLEGWYPTPTSNVRIAKGKTNPLTVTYSPEPIPGPEGNGCRLMNSGGAPYAPLPLFDILKLGGPVLSWPTEGYNFCGYLDTTYCSLPAIANQLDPQLQEFMELISCIFCDINGPVDRTADVPFTANGIPDGSFELGLLAEILNDPEQPLHEETVAAFQHNFFEAKEIMIEALSLYRAPGSDVDIRNMVNLLAPHLPGALAMVLAGFATLGDDQTYESMDEILLFLKGIGMQPIPGGIKSLMLSVPELGPEGDANGDGISNRKTYEWCVDSLAYDPESYVRAALTPGDTLGLLELYGGGLYDIGDPILLEARVSEGAVPLSYEWFKDGVLLNEYEGALLEIESAQESDAGLYELAVSMDLLFDSGNSAVLHASTTVEIVSPDTTPPQILLCADDQNAAADENCSALVPDFLEGLQAVDDRSSADKLVWAQEPASGAASGLGVHTITVSCTDESGNTSYCTAFFQVTDLTPPRVEFLFEELPVLQAAETGLIALPDLREQVEALDACTAQEELIVLQNPPAGTLLSAGETAVAFTAKDNAENISEARIMTVVVLPPVVPVEGEPEGEVEGEAVEGEPVEGEAVEGEPVEGEMPVEGEAVEGEPVEGEAVEGEPVEGEAVEGEPVEGEAVEGEPVEGEMPVEGEPVEGEPVEGEVVEGEVEGEPVEGEAVEGEAVEGEPVEGEAVEGEPVEGEAVEGEAVEGEPAEGEAAEGEPVEGEPVEGEPVEGEPVEGEVEPVEGEAVEGEALEGEKDDDTSGGCFGCRSGGKANKNLLLDDVKKVLADLLLISLSALVLSAYAYTKRN